MLPGASGGGRGFGGELSSPYGLAVQGVDAAAHNQKRAQHGPAVGQFGKYEISADRRGDQVRVPKWRDDREVNVAEAQRHEIDRYSDKYRGNEKLGEVAALEHPPI